MTSVPGGEEVPSAGTRPRELQSHGKRLCNVQWRVFLCSGSKISSLRVPAFTRRCFLVFRKGETPPR